MRHTYAKLMVLLLTLALVLSGCNLIDVDQVEQIAEERARVEKDYSAVLAEYDGGTVTIMDVLGTFYTQFSQMQSLYSAFGMSLDQETVDGLLEDCVNYELQSRVVAQEFEARGLEMSKTEDEIEDETESAYEDALAQYMESAEGDTDEVKRANAEFIMFTQGYTPETVRMGYIKTERMTAVQDDVRAEITELTDEELQQAYDDKVAADEETYSETPTQIESDANDEEVVVCWMPEGYRTVKHVLIVPEDEVLDAFVDARNALEDAQDDLEDLQAELDALSEGAEDGEEGDEEEDASAEATEEPRSEEEIQADIDAANESLPDLEAAVEEAEEACIASVQDRLDEAYAALEDGEDFDSVMAEYGEDPGMQSEPAMSNGYYVSADSTTWDQGFTDGAMALEQVGDYSETPAVSASGVHIIYYNSDVTPGAVPLEDVHDALYDQTLESRRDEHFTEELQSWVDAVNPVYHLDAWNLT